MNNLTNNQTIQKNITSVLNKLSGDDITKIIVTIVAAGTACYICYNNGQVEITHGGTKVVLKSDTSEVA